MILQVLHSSFKGVIRPLKIYDVFWTHEPQGVCLFHVLNHRFLLPCTHLSISLALVPSLLLVLALKAVLASPGPAAAQRGGIKDHARVINESLRKMTPSYCCLCFCIMDEGSNEEWAREEAKKRELCTFLVLRWMNLMSLIHTLPSCFFFYFSVSHVLCQHSAKLLYTIHSSFWSSGACVCVVNMKFTNTVCRD